MADTSVPGHWPASTLAQSLYEIAVNFSRHNTPGTDERALQLYEAARRFTSGPEKRCSDLNQERDLLTKRLEGTTYVALDIAAQIAYSCMKWTADEKAVLAARCNILHGVSAILMRTSRKHHSHALPVLVEALVCNPEGFKTYYLLGTYFTAKAQSSVRMEQYKHYAVAERMYEIALKKGRMTTPTGKDAPNEWEALQEAVVELRHKRSGRHAHASAPVHRSRAIRAGDSVSFKLPEEQAEVVYVDDKPDDPSLPQEIFYEIRLLASGAGYRQINTTAGNLKSLTGARRGFRVGERVMYSKSVVGTVLVLPEGAVTDSGENVVVVQHGTGVHTLPMGEVVWVSSP